MKKSFDLYEELLNKGFEKSESTYGDLLVKTYSKESDVCWYGKMTFTLTVEAWFNTDHTTVTVCYNSGSREDFKRKTHLNEKRALNAIRQTVENKEYAF